MQQNPVQAGDGSRSGGRRLPAAPVDLVADDRVAEAHRMHADLVGAPGLQGERHPGGPDAGRRQQPPVGHRPLAALADDGHALAVDRMTAERPIDGAGGRARYAPDDGLVHAVDRVDAELAGKADMRPVVLGSDHHAADLAVQPVHDTRSQHAADAGQARPAMGEQCIDQGIVGMARRWMDDHAGRLDQHHQMLVLEQDRELTRLGGRDGRPRRRYVEDEPFPRFDPVPGLVYQPLTLAQMPFADQGLQA